MSLILLFIFWRSSPRIWLLIKTICFVHTCIKGFDTLLRFVFQNLLVRLKFECQKFRNQFDAQSSNIIIDVSVYLLMINTHWILEMEMLFSGKHSILLFSVLRYFVSKDSRSPNVSLLACLSQKINQLYIAYNTIS